MATTAMPGQMTGQMPGQISISSADPNGSQMSAPEQQPQSMEHTASAPMQGKPDEQQNSNGLTKDDQQRCIALVRRYKAQWQQDRMLIMQRCLENLEFFKGNQYVSFDPANFQFFDAIAWFQDNDEDADDSELFKHCNNFYQMLCTGFVAALSPQVPKSVYLPENAEVLEDVATAKASQTLIDIIERQNKEHSMLKQQLLYMFTCGSQFRHTRYLVDADLAGTHDEPVFGVVDTQILPDRYHCFNCGMDNPAASMGLVMSRQCMNPKCASPLGPESYYPAVSGPMVQQTSTQEVPNGQVTQTIYSPLEIDCDPSAKTLKQTPILNKATEVHLAALRTSYPDMFDELNSASGAGVSNNGALDRLVRTSVYAEAGYTTAEGLDMKPTLDQTWIQPWAFALEDDKEFVARVKKGFPQGMLLINVGETFLEARPANLLKEWTWAGTHEGFGMYPPAPGDVILPFQKRYNNIANMIDDFMERCSAGMTLANTDVIDAKSINGKQLLPGVLNEVKFKRTAPGTSFADAIYQFKFELQETAYQYLEALISNAQLFAGIPAQVYGGEGDPNIQTKGGQEQQLNTAMGKLNIYWDNLREEHAEADELGIKCAQDNLTEDMRQVVQERGSEYRNNYVRLDDLQGNIKAYPDTDQGFPITASELRERWMNLIQQAATNMFVQEIFKIPANVQQAATALGVPSMVIPGSPMASKVYQVLDKLQKAKVVPAFDPQTGQPTGQFNPSVMPDQEIDDFDELRDTVRLYCQENSDLPYTNPPGWQNILAYLTTAKQMQVAYEAQEQANKSKVAQAGMPPPPQPPPQPQIPPGEINEVAGTLSNLMTLPPASTEGNIQGQVAAAGQLIKLGTALKP